MPITNKWKNLKESDLMVVFDKLDMTINIENLEDKNIQSGALLLLQNRSKAQRYKLHKHYKQFSSVAESKDNMPSGYDFLTSDNWKRICDYFAEPAYQVYDFIYTIF